MWFLCGTDVLNLGGLCGTEGYSTKNKELIDFKNTGKLKKVLIPTRLRLDLVGMTMINETWPSKIICFWCREILFHEI